MKKVKKMESKLKDLKQNIALFQKELAKLQQF